MSPCRGLRCRVRNAHRRTHQTPSRVLRPLPRGRPVLSVLGSRLRMGGRPVGQLWRSRPDRRRPDRGQSYSLIKPRVRSSHRSPGTRSPPPSPRSSALDRCRRSTPPAALSDDGRRSFTAHPCATSASWRPARQPGRPCQQQLLSPQAEPEDHPPAARAEQRVGSPPRSLPLPPWPCSAGSCRDCWRWTSCPGAQPSWPSGSNAPVSRGRTEPDRCRAGRAAYQLTKEKRAV